METTFGTRNRTNVISLNTFPTSPSRQLLTEPTAGPGSFSLATNGLMNGSGGLLKSKQFGSGGGGGGGGASSSGGSMSPTSPDFNRFQSQQYPRRFYSSTAAAAAGGANSHHHQHNSHINHLHYQPPAPPLPHHHHHQQQQHPVSVPRHPMPSSSSSLHFPKQLFGSSSTTNAFNGCASSSGCLQQSSQLSPTHQQQQQQQQQCSGSSSSSSATTTASSSSCSYYDPQLPKQHHRHHQHHQHHHHMSMKPRHTFVTNYGTEENLYEEIPPDRYFNTLTAGTNSVTGNGRRCPASAAAAAAAAATTTTSSDSSADLNVLEAEWKRVQTRHRQVLGQLNLEVETMLMPDESAYQAAESVSLLVPTATTANECSSANGDDIDDDYNDVDTIDDSIVSIGAGNPAISAGASTVAAAITSATAAAAAATTTTTKKPQGRHHDNIDSGFSGSSSSASYNGSFKRVGFTAAATAATQQPPPPPPCYLIETANSSSNLANHSKPSNSLLPSTNSLKQFFAKKSWRKLPGFSVLATANAPPPPPPTTNNSGCSTKNSSNSSMVTKNGDDKCRGEGGIDDSSPVRFLPFSTPVFLATTTPVQQRSLSPNRLLIDKQQLNRRRNRVQRTSIGEPVHLPQPGTPRQLIVAELEEDCSRRQLVEGEQQQQQQQLELQTFNCQTHVLPPPATATTISFSQSTTKTTINNSITSTANGLCPQNCNNNNNSHSIEPNPKPDRHPSNNPIDLAGQQHTDTVKSGKTSASPFRNGSQFRSTLNKAKNLCDKWRGSITSHSERPVAELVSGNSHTGRLSRLFSIKRSNTQQYDIETIENAQFADQQNTAGLVQAPPMPVLAENCDDTKIDLVTREEQLLELAPLLPEIEIQLSRSQLKRRMIVADIVDSENSYVATLNCLVYDFKKPLEESRPEILDRKKVATLFRCLPEILQCHRSFRELLAASVRHWDRDELIGEAFFKAFAKPHVLHVYSDFINNFTTAMQTAKAESKRKSALNDFFLVKQISSNSRLSFFALMVKPVQRFPQFILLLQDLLKHTPHNHHDRISLQLALTQLESVAESLNERKRESEQMQALQEMLTQIGCVRKFGLKKSVSMSSSSASSSSVPGVSYLQAKHTKRFLLKETDMVLLKMNPNGLETKMKKRRLLLLTDLVVCLSVSPVSSASASASSSKRQSVLLNQKNERLTLKWAHPLADLELVDAVHSPTVTRMLLQQRSGNNTSKTIAPDRKLSEELAALMHDYKIISQIIEMLGSLKENYDGDGNQDDSLVNVAAFRSLLDRIRARMREKDEQIAQLDSCCLQLARRNGPDTASGAAEVLMFRTDSAATKHEWITEIRLAQLALDANNSPAWLIDGGERPVERPVTKMPLFVREMPVGRKFPDANQNIQVCCGTFYSRRVTATGRRKSKSKSVLTNYVWIGTTDESSNSSQLIAMLQTETGNESFRVERTINLSKTCVTVVESVCDSKGRAGGTIWCGTANGKLVVYDAATDTADLTVMGSVTLRAAITAICYCSDSVFVALRNGSIAVFGRDYYDKNEDDGLWILDDYELIEIPENGANNEPVSCLLPIANYLYAACDRVVAVVAAETAEITKRHEIQHENFGRIGQMASSGVSLWLASEHSPIICLYHTETFRHLQDLNIAPAVARIDSWPMVTVTKLIASKGLLWIGTNVGVVVTVRLPRLEGVPIISGQLAVSYHGHFGPIRFLLPLLATTYANNHGRSSARPRNRLRSANASASNTMTSIATATSTCSSSGSSNGDEKKVSRETGCSSVRRTKTMSGTTDITFENPRLSKTLPRRKPGGGYRSDDVYGLYGDLMYVKEYADDSDAIKDNDCTSALFNSPIYETLRRSDPELDISTQVRTIDRRMKSKLTRPRSLDTSDWSVASKTSSIFTTSSTSDDNFRVFSQFLKRSISSSLSSPKNVSRNNSNVSAISAGNENNSVVNGEKMLLSPAAAATAATTTNATKAVEEQDPIAVQSTILIAMAGCGYRKFEQKPNKEDAVGTAVETVTADAPKKQRDLNQAHVIFWESRL